MLSVPNITHNTRLMIRTPLKELMHRTVSLLALLGSGWLLGPLAYAQSPFHYQGVLQYQGAPTSGSFSMRFTLFDAPIPVPRPHPVDTSPAT